MRINIRLNIFNKIRIKELFLLEYYSFILNLLNNCSGLTLITHYYYLPVQKTVLY